jgi:hypothetical protein
MTTLVTTYFLALLWYRFSDYWQYFLQLDDEENTRASSFVVVFKLKPPSGNETFDEEEYPLAAIHARLITCMYYALTTLATVGYGDYYPCSIAEKIAGSVI